MPTEVLVMCTRCGRPQPARPGNCVACGELLPDAPRPAASQAPFFRLEGSGGRSVTGAGRTLTYLSSPHAMPVTLELSRIESVGLESRSNIQVLLLVAVLLFLWFKAQGPWFLLAIIGLAALPIYLLRWHNLAVLTREGATIRWFLGLAWAGSRRIRALEEAWDAQSGELVSRYEAARDASGPPGSSA